MCLLCVEYQQGRLRLEEARRNFRELRSSLPPGHAREVQEWMQKAKEEQKEESGKATSP